MMAHGRAETQGKQMTDNHTITILGANMVCTTCDKTVASLVGWNHPSSGHWNIDAAHQNEVLAYIAPEVRDRVRLIYSGPRKQHFNAGHRPVHCDDRCDSSN